MTSVGILGAAGDVGAAIAFVLATRASGLEVVLHDAREARLRTHLMDLGPLCTLQPLPALRIGSASDAASCDVVVVAASAPHRDGATRMELLHSSGPILAQLAPSLTAAPPTTVILVVTNPVDVLCTLLVQRCGLPRERVLGYSMNDSLRLRHAIAKVLDVAPSRVRAWSIGEHGTHAVPLLDRVEVGGSTVRLGKAQRTAVLEEVGGWYDAWQRERSGRTPAWSTAVGAAMMIEALRDGSEEPWPMSIMLDGEYDVRGVALTVPVCLRRGSCPRPLEWPLAARELAAMRGAAEAVGAAAERSEGWSCPRDSSQSQC